MGSRDSRIDTYIAKAPEFAQPFLEHLRAIVHTACPDAEETMKWSRPHFLYKGMLCGMGYFKEYCSFGFWKGSLIVKDSDATAEKAMGDFGRITKVSDLPSKKVLTGYIKQAMKLNDEGVKTPSRTKPKVRKELVIPDELTNALRKNAKAKAAFDKFSPSHKREYVEWITEAKTEATRNRRLETAIEWMAAGKSRNWKYTNC